MSFVPTDLRKLKPVGLASVKKTKKLKNSYEKNKNEKLEIQIYWNHRNRIV